MSNCEFEFPRFRHQRTSCQCCQSFHVCTPCKCGAKICELCKKECHQCETKEKEGQP